MREQGWGEQSDGSAPARAGSRHPEWRLSTDPGDGSLPRTEAIKDEIVRQWDVVTPSATLIGRPERPGEDLSDTVRRLHDEQHPAMEGHSERMHRLDKARITQALCNRLDLTSWERDRTLGVILEVDLTEFGSQRAIATVALVVIKYVVDSERKRRLGLDDPSNLDALTPDEMESLYDRFVSISDEQPYQELLEAQELTITNVNRLTRVLRDQIEGTPLEHRALGRQPHRDPSLPAISD